MVTAHWRAWGLAPAGECSALEPHPSPEPPAQCPLCLSCLPLFLKTLAEARATPRSFASVSMADKPLPTILKPAQGPSGWTTSTAREGKPASSSVPGAHGAGTTAVTGRTWASPATWAARGVACTWVFLSDWWMEKMRRKDEWRSTSMASGGQSVTMAGLTRMRLWSADNWAI
ncbi:Hypothetical predicted protein, partial [Marmota monax]